MAIQLAIALLPAQVQATTESALDGLQLFLYGNINQISIPIDTLKNNITGSAGQQALDQYITSLPPCSGSEMTELNNLNTINGTFILCKPSDDLINSLYPIIWPQIESSFGKIPDEIKISLPLTTLKKIRFYLNLLYWIPILPLLFLLGIALLSKRSIKNGLRTGGILLFIGGLLALAIALIFRSGAKPALGLLLGYQNRAVLTDEMINFLDQLGEYIVYQVTDWEIYPSLIIILIGLLAWMGSALIRNKVDNSVFLPPDTNPTAIQQ